MTAGEISHGGSAIPGWLRTTETSAQLSASSARFLAIWLAAAMIAAGVWLLVSAPDQTDSQRVAQRVPVERDAPASATASKPERHVEAPAPQPPATEPPAPRPSAEQPTEPPAIEPSEPAAPSEDPGEDLGEDPSDDPGEDPSEDASAAEPTTRDPAAAQKLAERAQTAYKGGSRSSARKLFSDALALDPDNDVALIGLSNLSFDSGKYSSATSYARRAVKVAPRNADYRVRLGDAYFKQGKHDRARAQYQRAAKLGHPFASRRLAQLPGS